LLYDVWTLIHAALPYPLTAVPNVTTVPLSAIAYLQFVTWRALFSNVLVFELPFSYFVRNARLVLKVQTVIERPVYTVE